MVNASTWQVRDTLSGVAGAVALTAAGCPFDVVKIRLQTASPGDGCRLTPFALLRSIVQREGALSLWRGSTPALSSALVENAVVFTASRVLTRLVADGRPEELSFAQHAVIGGASGVFSATAICPPEVIKCRLQAARASSSSSATATSVLTDLLRREGVRGLFAGLSPLLLRDVPFNTLFFGSYKVLTAGWEWVGTRGGGRPPGGGASQLQAFVCGGLAGVSAWSVIFPFDTLKSRMQTAGAGGSGAGAQGGQRSVGAVLRAVLAEGGGRALYRGYSAAVARAFPANAALFWGVETSDRLMREAGW